MDAQILSLKCPSCGNTSNLGGKDVQYGFQFTCQHCQTTSVLIINKQLYTPKLGEHVCINCGRIAFPNARFCQCGSALVRRCNNLDCLKEIPVDHSICDFCGWSQDAPSSSDKGFELIIKNAVIDLKDSNSRVREDALEKLRIMGPKASAAIPVIYNIYNNANSLDEKFKYINCLGDLGEKALPTLIEILSSTNWHIRNASLEKIRHIGPKASGSIPVIFNLFNECSDIEQKEMLINALSDLGVSAIPVLIEILYSETDENLLDSAHYCLETFGTNALPALRNLAKSTFSNKTRARAKNIIFRIENK